MSQLKVLAAAGVASLMAASPAAACGLLDLGCILGGGSGGGTGGVPEIDASAGLAAMALLACVAAIIHRKHGN